MLESVVLAIGTSAALILVPSLASAQSAWPSKPIKLIVPFAPGGPVDQLVRTIAPGLTRELGQSIVVETKAGAGGALGVDFVVKAEADGYTIGFGVPGAITVLPHLQKLPYEAKSINFISLVARVPQVIAVGPKTGAGTLSELIAASRRQPNTLNFASAGNATSSHLGCELLRQEGGADMTHVPCKGAAPAMTALLAGEVQVLCADVVAVLPFVSRGVKILATNGVARLESLPDVPTSTELGRHVCASRPITG